MLFIRASRAEMRKTVVPSRVWTGKCKERGRDSLGRSEAWGNGPRASALRPRTMWSPGLWQKHYGGARDVKDVVTWPNAGACAIEVRCSDQILSGWLERVEGENTFCSGDESPGKKGCATSCLKRMRGDENGVRLVIARGNRVLRPMSHAAMDNASGTGKMLDGGSGRTPGRVVNNASVSFCPPSFFLEGLYLALLDSMGAGDYACSAAMLREESEARRTVDSPFGGGFVTCPEFSGAAGDLIANPTVSGVQQGLAAKQRVREHSMDRVKIAAGEEYRACVVRTHGRGRNVRMSCQSKKTECAAGSAGIGRFEMKRKAGYKEEPGKRVRCAYSYKKFERTTEGRGLAPAFVFTRVVRWKVC